MHYQDSMGYRYPKGRFAMFSVYSFTGAAVITSTVFSLLLFLSIDDDPMMKVLFGTLAVIFEAGKFFAWYEYGERRAHRNFSGAFVALFFYLILAAISVGGSIGGINSATNKAQSHLTINDSKISSYNRQIEAIEKQIALNDLAAKKYIEMERIASGVDRIQRENNKLRQEQLKLAAERDALPPVTQGSAIGLIDSIAKSLKLSAQDAQLALVIFLSFLLDFFAAFFVGVIGEELRFRQFFRRHREVTIDAIATPVPAALLERPSANSDNELSTAAENLDEENAIEPVEEPLPLEQQVENALSDSVIPCSKKAVIRHFNLSNEKVDMLFKDMSEKGMIAKKANNHYYWVKQEPETV
ncbi:Preprotein translocase subunit SecY [Veronia pacifica]|uniref:Preprotein translocase subunit SecY n=1 Tax=Veronia pacifica TaxID=1080227 RepID=UPI0036334165